jgi:hypothetical protein
LWRLKELVQIFVECLENMENVVNYSLQHCYLAFLILGFIFMPVYVAVRDCY